MKNIRDFEDLLIEKYGEKGSESRDIYDANSLAFRLGVMLKEARQQAQITQEQLAEKCGTTKTYISRIENNASDIRLSTLMRIIREGLGGHLKLHVDM